jgi:hypothetical protein
MSDQKHDENATNRPQVIDLQAEEIKAEDAAAPSHADGPGSEPPQAEWTPPPAPAPHRRSGGAAKWIVTGLVLGAIGGGWLYRDVLSAYLPSSEMTALSEKVGALAVNNSALESQLADLQKTVQATASSAAAAREASSAIEAQIGKADQGLATLGTNLDTTNQRLSAAEQAITSASADLDSLRKSLSASGTTAVGGAPADSAALAALSQRLDALEKDVASLKSAATAPGQANATAALSQALADLKAKVAAGTPYAAETERIARMVPAAAGLDVVSAFAADGVPTAQQLAEQLRGLIPALPEPAKPVAADDSYFGTLMKSLSGIITIREIGDTDWRQVAEKAAVFASEGDLPQAIASIDSAEGDKPVPLIQWREKAAARLQLDAALEQVSDAVLRQITALGGAQ